MRVATASCAIIKHRFRDEEKYLLQQNQGWQGQFSFIGGGMEHEDQGNSMITMAREIEEELPPFVRDLDFELSALSPGKYEGHWVSERNREKTSYIFYLFHVIFSGRLQAEVTELLTGTNSINQWFSMEEIRYPSLRSMVTRFPVPQIMTRYFDEICSLGDSFK